ncbi:Thyroxine 5-deiodinase [Nibea albiflora]|uniref:Thyroxine 5-deiodinase n=1 Tax=Nibea albiflora TaxID=240163 RepID=A0ACB7FAH1_NIBAL|nr:Thyroxine 5-deiodinase [Nibea albiflora]
MLTEVPGTNVVVDNMDNSSNAAYGAYFERLYIVRDERVVYQGGRGPEGYRISELRNWLEQYRNDLAGCWAAAGPDPKSPALMQRTLKPSVKHQRNWDWLHPNLRPQGEEEEDGRGGRVMCSL